MVRESEVPIRTDRAGVEVSYAGWFDVQNLQMLELPPKATLGREIIDWYIKTYSI
jgi:hypothetical protein